MESSNLSFGAAGEMQGTRFGLGKGTLRWCLTPGMDYLDMVRYGYNDTLHGSSFMFNTGD